MRGFSPQNPKALFGHAYVTFKRKGCEEDSKPLDGLYLLNGSSQEPLFYNTLTSKGLLK